MILQYIKNPATRLSAGHDIKADVVEANKDGFFEAMVELVSKPEVSNAIVCNRSSATKIQHPICFTKTPDEDLLLKVKNFDYTKSQLVVFASGDEGIPFTMVELRDVFSDILFDVGIIDADYTGVFGVLPRFYNYEYLFDIEKLGSKSKNRIVLETNRHRCIHFLSSQNNERDGGFGSTDKNAMAVAFV